MTPQETFITRLRRQRERQRISLDAIVAETRIKQELLDAFERGDLSEWPRGIYARSWVRGYAEMVGLDPSDTVDEFCRLFPQGDRRSDATVREIAAVVSEPSGFSDEFQGSDRPDRRRRSTDPPAGQPKWRDQLARAAKTVRPLRHPRPGTVPE